MSRAREERRKNTRLALTLSRNPAYSWACPKADEHPKVTFCGWCAYDSPLTNDLSTLTNSAATSSSERP